MIVRTKDRAEFQEFHAEMKSKGYAQISNAILPNWIAGDNFIEIADNMGIFALCSRDKAERDGFMEFKEYLTKNKR